MLFLKTPNMSYICRAHGYARLAVVLIAREVVEAPVCCAIMIGLGTILISGAANLIFRVKQNIVSIVRRRPWRSKRAPRIKDTKQRVNSRTFSTGPQVLGMIQSSGTSLLTKRRWPSSNTPVQSSRFEILESYLSICLAGIRERGSPKDWVFGMSRHRDRHFDCFFSILLMQRGWTNRKARDGSPRSPEPS